MHKNLFILIASLVSLGTASAQDAAPMTYDGQWSASIQREGASRRVSRLVIREFAGTWYGSTGQAANAKAACHQKKFPITVQESSDSALAFTVWGDAVGPGCANLTVELKPAGKNRLEGSVASVGTIQLTRR